MDDPARAPERARPSAVVLGTLAALAVVLARLPVLFALRDSHFPFEIFSGSVAVALLEGLELDVSSLTIVSHVRGGPLFGVLAVPLYALLGSSLTVLKLVPLLWHAASVGVLAAAVQALAGRRAALATAALFVCAPPLVAKLSVLAFASHLESALPLALGLLLAAPVFASRQLSWGRALALGLLLGFAGFFHLQALLGGLLLLGLLGLAAPRAVLLRSPALLLGAALLAAPSWAFAGGNMDLLEGMVGKHATPSPALAAAGPLGERTVFSPGEKTSALLREGLAPTLEFGSLGKQAGYAVAVSYDGALLILVLLAVLMFARSWWGWPLLARGTGGVLALYLLLHALGLGFAFFDSGMPWDLWYAGSGMENRRLVLVLVSLMALSALPVANAVVWQRRLATGLVLLLCSLGVAGQVGFAWGGSASTSSNRGENLEWFMRQLDHHAEGDTQAVIDTILRVDRGDPRFLSLRYRIQRLVPPPQRSLAENLARARAYPQGAARMLALTHVGRGLGQDGKAVDGLSGNALLDKLSVPECAALLHGVGLGTDRPQPGARKSFDGPDGRVRYLAYLFQSPRDLAVLEGLGFAMGQVLDPYNRLMRVELSLWSSLPAGARDAIYRGLGWGYRQRMRQSPSEPLGSLRVLADVPAEGQAAFRAGLLLTSLPAEAAVLGGGSTTGG